MDALLEGGLASGERTEQVLALMRERIGGPLDAVAVIVVILDVKGRVLFANRRGCQLLGCEDDSEILGRDWIETFVPEHRRAETREVFTALWAGDAAGAGTNENEVVMHTGEERLVAWTNEVLCDEAGEVWGVVGTGVDVTEQRRTERRLELRRRALEDARDGIGILSGDGCITYMNPSLRALTGYTPEELDAGDGPLALFPDPGTGRGVFLQTVREGTWAGEVKMRVRGGAERTILLRTDLIRDGRGHALGMVGIHTDITEQRLLEAEVLRATDEERQRLGRDLHDGLASHLLGLGMVTRGLARRIAREHPALAEELAEIAENVRDGAEQARAIARGLNPVSIDGEGLRVALGRLAALTDADDGLRCSFVSSPELPPVRAETAMQLYRIAQEAVTNALRHAEASHIKIALRTERGDGTPGLALVLSVEDDGRGLSAPPQGGGLGLQTMVYRAHLIGARLDLSRRNGGGVAVTCRLPLR